MKITVVGTGYVGLVTAAVFSKFGHEVVGLDILPEKVKKLKTGQVPFFEPGLQELLKKGLVSKKLQFTTNYKDALKDSQVVFICVGTPSKKSGEINLDYIKSACESVAKNLSQDSLVVIKSTVPPGIKKEVEPIFKKHAKHRWELATTPEFLREGSAVKDSLNPDRVIIGAESKKAAKVLKKLHQPLNAPIYVFDINSAQMVKYSANAFLANKISFANQIANLCDRVDADARKVMLGLGLDNRIGTSFLNPGLGFGGSCFPKDTAALSYLAQAHGMDLDMVDCAIKINHQQVQVVFEKIKKLLGNLENKTVAVWGLSFKPNTDDMRQAQSVPLIKKLTLAGAKVNAFDPVATKNAKKALSEIKKSISFFNDQHQTAKGADLLILVTEWDEFKNPDFEKLKKLMSQPNIVDARNHLDPKEAKKHGFKYLGVGVR